MITLFSNSLYSFHLLDVAQPVILFDWTDKNAEMSYEDFQSACHNYAGFAWQYQCRHLLVDTRAFVYQLPPQFGEWREKELNPRYYQLGVLKFAYITRPELISIMKDLPGEDGRFETRHFISQREALRWLNQDV
jgi:hypothetical protein